VTIRAKLYTAIVVTVAGLACTAGVGIWALNELSSRFDNVQSAADARALALELKFDVTDFNGWQTAYGYDAGRSRGLFLAAVARFKTDLSRARATFDTAAERRLLDRIDSGGGEFMRVDAQAWTALKAGRSAEVRRLFLGPEIRNFHTVAAAAQELAAAEDVRAANEERAFKRSRKDALRLLILAAVVAGAFVAILLVTANDLAREAELAVVERRRGDEGAA
jgi:methyl-accepting chemotaxis protein